jgi:hypothetical protein
MQRGDSDSAAPGDTAALREHLECFRYEGYCRLLDRFRTSHAFCRFGNVLPKNGAFVLLRHDVDLSLEAAAQMAELEADAGVTSTYFLLFSSPFYNLFEPGAEKALRRIAGAGHEIGLHYDAAAMEQQAVEGGVEAMAKLEAALLSNMAGAEVRSVSMHNPSLFSGGDPLATDMSFVNAQAGRLRREVAYHSDSCGGWRTATLDALTGPELPRRLQLLTHAELWSPEGASRWDQLDMHLARRRQEFSDAVRFMLEVYNDHPGRKEHDARRRTAG